MGSDLVQRLVLIVSLSSFFLPHIINAHFINHTPAAHTTTAPINAAPKARPVAAAIAAGTLDAAITRVCHSTDYPSLCLSSLKPYLDGKTDVISLLHAEIEASKHHTAAACTKARDESRNPKTDATTASLLTDCKSSFDDALASLKEAEEAMKTRDLDTVNTKLSAAMTGFGDCDDFLGQGTDGPEDSPDAVAKPANVAVSTEITKVDKTLKSLVSNCLAIASLAHH